MMADTKEYPVLFALFGLNRAGQILYVSLVFLAIIGGAFWLIEVPKLRFHEADERLFRAARHGDVAGIAQAIGAGADVNAAAPVDGKTALFRAAVFGYADAVRLLLKDGADPERRGHDGRSAMEIVEEARTEEHDPGRVHDLDLVVKALREVER